MFIGIDPDLHDLAIGFWDAKRGPVGASVVHVKRTKGVIKQAAVLQMVSELNFGGQLKNIIDSFIGWTPLGGLAVEAQTLRRTGAKQHERPEDIVVLGNVAGAVLGIVSTYAASPLYFPTPEEWKGQLPKDVMQARLYSDLGWGYERVSGYARPLRAPKEFANISAGQWKHVGDALLLARWASQQ